jgi:hypothetical protein
METGIKDGSVFGDGSFSNLKCILHRPVFEMKQKFSKK